MYSTQGIILKKHDIGEVNALFTIYTKDFGKIRAMAQGVKKENAKLKGHLEPLSLASVQFIIGKSGERLTHADLINFWPKIRENIDTLQKAWYVAELIDRHCFPGERDENLWDLLYNSFVALENTNTDGSTFVDDFEKSFLVQLGYGGEDMRVLEAFVARPW